MSTAALLSTTPRRVPPRTHAAPEPAAPLRINVVGTLACDAQMRLTPGNRLATVVVLLEQPAGRPPLRAVELFGDSDSAHHFAYRKARSLREGMEVELIGEGLRSVTMPRLGEVVQLARVDVLRPTQKSFDAARAAANDKDDGA